MARDNKLLGQFELSGIPPAPRGVPQIEVTFDIDANGIVHVSAKEIKTGKEQKVSIQSSSGLSKDDIEKLVKEAEINAEADKKKRDLIDAKNSAESVVYQTEKVLHDYKDKIPSENVEKINEALNDLKANLSSDDAALLKEKTDLIPIIYSQNIFYLGDVDVDKLFDQLNILRETKRLENLENRLLDETFIEDID